MAPTSGTALILLVAFVLPGFVVVLLQERTFKKEDAPSPFDRLLTSVYYSVWCYLSLGAVALFSNVDRPWVDTLIDRYENDPAELVWRGSLLVLGPAVLVAIVTLVMHESGASRRLQGFLRVNARHQVPTGWDFYFRQRPNVYVRVLLSNGKTIVGYYGGASFAAYSKDGGDLYLQQVIHPNEWGEDAAVADEPSAAKLDASEDPAEQAVRQVEEPEADREIGGRSTGSENVSDWLGTEFENGTGVWLKGEDVVAVKFYALPHDEPSEEKWWRRIRGKGTQALSRVRPRSAAGPGQACSASEAAEEDEVDD